MMPKSFILFLDDIINSHEDIDGWRWKCLIPELHPLDNKSNTYFKNEEVIIRYCFDDGKDNHWKIFDIAQDWAPVTKCRKNAN